MGRNGWRGKERKGFRNRKDKRKEMEKMQQWEESLNKGIALQREKLGRNGGKCRR